MFIYMIFSQIERLSAILQGKGYGSSTLKKEVAVALSLLGRKPVTFVDVGGNKGGYTEHLLRNSPAAQVHIFEPSAENISILKTKFDQDSRVKLNHCALGKARDRAILYADIPGSGLASLSNRRLDHFGISMNIEEQVDVIAFHEYWTEQMNQIQIDLVKIDVEGHEMDVLQGFGDVIKVTKAIQFEFGGCNIDTRTYFQDFWYFFKNTGFAIFRIGPLGLKAITAYSEWDERFTTTNYLALKR